MRAWAVILVGALGMAAPVLAEDAAVVPDVASDAASDVVESPMAQAPAPVLGEDAAATPEAADAPMDDAPAPAAQVAEPAAPPADGPRRDERLWTCETSLSGERTEVNYVRDDEFRQNVGRIEKNFSGWGRISCPGYVTLREILRRNQMADDGSYCLLWDKANDTYIGAQIGPRKGNALCRKTFCERVNGARAATFRNANALAIAGYDAVTQRPGATILAATSGQMVGTLEAAGAAAAGIAASPVAVGSMVIGTAAVGGSMWYCAEE